MSSEQSQQVQDLLAGALERPPDERRAYLDRTHPEPDEVRATVEQKLAEQRPASSQTLTRPITVPAPESMPDLPSLDGQTVSHYQIESLLGEGSMGRVYRARDLRIGRLVAIKFISPRLITSEDQKHRFEREARVLGQLAHPHLCALFDVGEHAGMPFIVMEYLDGETLEERLLRGPLPVEATVAWAEQVADALLAAHRHGVIHRDIKPSNIMLTGTGAKLLDFGVARLELAGWAGQRDVSVTREGEVVGTVRYMAPEQLQGGTGDARSDVFAFGAVLYEMLTGRQAFEGQSAASVIAAILVRPVELPSSTQPRIPAGLDRVVTRCLAKNPAERWPGMADIVHELHWAATTAPAPAHVLAPAVAPRSAVAWTRWAWLTALAAAVLVLAFLVSRPAVPKSPTWHLTLLPPPKTSFWLRSRIAELAVSPDGRSVAFVAGDANGDSSLWVRRLDSLETISLTGTENARFPFWSPDGQEVGFFAAGALRRVSVAGGPPRVVCPAEDGRGGTWNSEGVILFAPSSDGGLMQVASSGGAPSQVTRPDKSRRHLSHRWPQFLPDGKQFLFQAQAEAGGQPGVYAGSLGSESVRRLVEDSSAPIYAEPGYLLTRHNGQLIGRRMNPRRLTVDTTAVQIVERVSGSVSSGRISAAAGSNTLVYGARTARETVLTWLSREGRSLGSVPGAWPGARFTSMTPDGRRVAFEQPGPMAQPLSKWLLDTARGTRAPLAGAEPADHSPLLSPDGTAAAYSCRVRGSQERLCLTRANGVRTEIATPPATTVTPLDWSRDGRRLLFESYSGGVVELSWLDIETGQSHSISRMEGDGTEAQFSPDGRWIAFVVRSGRTAEVFLQAFPGSGQRWPVSRERGMRPRWRGDGRELFYLEPSEPARLMSVAVRAEGSVELGAPTPLFAAPPSLLNYFVTADGQRFLLNAAQDDFNEALSVFVNWPPER